MKTIQEFCEKQQLRVVSRAKIDERPDMDSSDKWGRTADHWIITIVREGFGPVTKLTTFYSKGSGHKGKGPNLYEVLDSLRSDASMADDTFESWCSDLGYDTDSRKALATYEACREIAKKLRNLLGDEAYRELMTDVESL